MWKDASNSIHFRVGQGVDVKGVISRYVTSKGGEAVDSGEETFSIVVVACKIQLLHSG